MFLQKNIFQFWFQTEMNNVLLKRRKTQLDWKLFTSNFQDEQSKVFLVISRFQMFDNVLSFKKTKEIHLENFLSSMFKMQDNYLQLYLLLESDFTERVDLNNVANSIQLIGLTCKLRGNLSFFI